MRFPRQFLIALQSLALRCAVARPRGRVPARLSSLELMCVDYYLAGLIGHAVRLPGIQTLVFSPFPTAQTRAKTR